MLKQDVEALTIMYKCRIIDIFHKYYAGKY